MMIITICRLAAIAVEEEEELGVGKEEERIELIEGIKNERL